MPELQRARRERLGPVLTALGADAALITSPANVRYLTGLASSNAALLLPDAPAGNDPPGKTARQRSARRPAGRRTGSGPGPVLATDSRYAGTARESSPDLEILIERQIEPALARVAATRGCAGSRSRRTR